MKKIMDKIEKVLTPLSEKVESNFILTVLKKAMTFTIPITIVGSIYLMILYFPWLKDMYPESFKNILTGVLGPIYNLSIPLLSVWVAIAIGYFYGEAKETNKLMNSVTALISFLMVTPMTDGNLTVSWLGASGMFVAILTSFVGCFIYNKIVEANITIKLPESVPPMVAEPFIAIIPLCVVGVVLGLINFLCTMTSYGSLHAIVFNLLQIPLMGLGTSLPALLIAIIFSNLLWWCGVHGTSIMNAVMQPIWTAALTTNLELIAAGMAPTYIVTKTFVQAFILGNQLVPLGFLLLFASKSERCKMVGKVGFAPIMFCIGEPIVFGLPIVGNAIMLIPFILNILVRAVISYGAMAIGLVPLTNGQTFVWTMPTVLSGFLTTGSVQGAILQIVLVIVGIIIFYPFFKVLDNQYLELEKAENSEE